MPSERIAASRLACASSGLVGTRCCSRMRSAKRTTFDASAARVLSFQRTTRSRTSWSPKSRSRFAASNGSGGGDEAVAFGVVEVDDDEPARIDQFAVRMQVRAAAVAQPVAARVLIVAFGDAIGIRVHQDVADVVSSTSPTSRATAWPIAFKPLPPAFRGLIDDAQRRRIGVDADARRLRRRGARRASAIQRAGKSSLRERSLRSGLRASIERDRIAGQRAVFRRRAQRGGGQARRAAELEHVAAERGDAACRRRARRACVEQIARAGQRARRRRVEPAQIRRAPRGEIEREAGQFDLRDFRPPRGFEAFAFRPQAIRDAGGDAPGASGALIGGGLRDRHRFQPRETGVRIEPRLAREAQCR